MCNNTLPSLCHNVPTVKRRLHYLPTNVYPVFRDRAFNKTVCIKLLHLEDVTLFYVMDTTARYSAAHVVSSTAIQEAIYAFELNSVPQFWPPNAVHVDRVFQTEAFQPSISKQDIQLRPVPLGRHEKNMIVPCQGFICSIFARLRYADKTASAAVLVVQSV